MVCGTPDPKNYKKLYNNVGVSFINKKPYECGAKCRENDKSILTAPSWS